MIIRFATVAAVGLTVMLAGAGVASAKTKDQAYQAARQCLLAKAGAKFVGRRGDGGGYAVLAHGSTFWTYRLAFGFLVSSTTVDFAGRPAPSAAVRAKVRTCLIATMD